MVNTVQASLFFFEKFYLSMKTEFELHVAWPHANSDFGRMYSFGLLACESIPCGKAERNINTHALANYFGRKR